MMIIENSDKKKGEELFMFYFFLSNEYDINTNSRDNAIRRDVE